MYFHSRAEAGAKLAESLMQYRYENCAVIALNSGGVTIGEQIAIRLHSVLSIFLSEKIAIPGEDTTLGVVSQDGSFVYNQSMSQDEVNDYYSEFHAYIDDQKREHFERINRLIVDGGTLDAHALGDHVVILVADGLKSTGSLDAVAEFLKPVKIKRLILAMPIASLTAVDRMHIMADELHCLAVTDNYLATSHYYDINDVPSHEEAIKKVNDIVLHWQ